ncbi:MAG: glycine betaine ABC transporter substrate-binding protein [Ilumatobacteraceae bacterium]
MLAQVYGQALAADGFAVDYQAVGGYRDVMFNALDSGDVNFTLEYAASALEFLNGQAGQATSDIDETMELLSAQLRAKGLVAGNRPTPWTPTPSSSPRRRPTPRCSASSAT